MKIVKYCKEEHNIALGCDTLHLGTFQYYRELDPEFSIADESEGYIQYLGPETEITVGANELNAITGGAMRISDATTTNTPFPPLNPGGTEIKMSDSNFVWGEDGKLRATVNKNLEVKLFYPNSYIFCASILEDKEQPDPSKVSPDYNSAYEIKEKDFGPFYQNIIHSLLQQVLLSDLKIENLLKCPLLELQNQFQVQCLPRPVVYVPEKEIRLNQASDFTKNRFTDIYIDSIFKKHESYASEREYRFVFLLRHATLGYLSVQKEPKILQMKPISNQIQAL